jgi:hypothetical protein
MTLIIIVFLLLILMPIFLVFAKWVTIHRQGTTQARVHTKEYHVANGAFDVTRYLIQSEMTGTPTWDLTNTWTTTLHVDSGTVVTVNLTNIGTP